MSFYRDTWAEVDLDAIVYNVQQIKKLHPNKKILRLLKQMAMVMAMLRFLGLHF